MSIFKKATVFVDKKGIEHPITRPFEDTGGVPPLSNSLQRTNPKDIRNPIPQENGKPLPCLAEQWKRDIDKKIKKGKANAN